MDIYFGRIEFVPSFAVVCGFSSSSFIYSHLFII